MAASRESCLRDLPDGSGVPQMMNVDFAKESISGPKHVTEIRFMKKNADQVLLQGIELGYGSTMALDKGVSMVLTLVNRDDSWWFSTIAHRHNHPAMRSCTERGKGSRVPNGRVTW